MNVDFYKTDMIQMLLRKDEKSFSGLYDQYAGALYGIILKEEPNEAKAVDLLQQTFITIWTDIENYNSSKERLLTWLIKKTFFTINLSTGGQLHASVPAVSELAS